MGWWKSGLNNDIIGDVPADLLSEMLLKKVIKKEHTGEKPTLSDLLAAILTAFRSEQETILGVGDAISIRRLVATINPGEEVITSEEGLADDENLVRIIIETLELINTAYQDTLDRNPSQREILACFAFILGDHPEKYLSGIQGRSVQEIVAEYE